MFLDIIMTAIRACTLLKHLFSRLGTERGAIFVYLIITDRKKKRCFDIFNLIVI